MRRMRDTDARWLPTFGQSEGSQEPSGGLADGRHAPPHGNAPPDPQEGRNRPVVLVTGDRNWGDAAIMRAALATLPIEAVLIHGDARGADRMAGELWFDRVCHLRGSGEGIEAVRRYPAQWNVYGRRAGPLRNGQMLAAALHDGRDVRCVAFHNDLPNSKGTRDMVRRCLAAGVRVTLVTSTGWSDIEEVSSE